MATGSVTVETLSFAQAHAQWHLPALGHGILFTLVGESRVRLPAAPQPPQQQREAVTEALSAFVQECTLDVSGDAPWAAVPAGATTLAKLSVLPLPVRACFSSLTLEALDAPPSSGSSSSSSSSSDSTATARFTLRLVVGSPTQTPFAFKHDTVRRYLAALCADPVGAQPFAVVVRHRAPRSSRTSSTTTSTSATSTRPPVLCAIVTDAARLEHALATDGRAPLTTPGADAAALVRRRPRSRAADAAAVLRWLCAPLVFAAAAAVLQLAPACTPRTPLAARWLLPQNSASSTTSAPPAALHVATRAQAWALGEAEGALAQCATPACTAAVLARAAAVLGVPADRVTPADLAALRTALPTTTEDARTQLHLLLLCCVVAAVVVVAAPGGVARRLCAPVRTRAARGAKALWRAVRPAVRWAHDHAVLEAAAYAVPLDLVAAGARHAPAAHGALVTALGVAAAVPCFVYSTVLHGCAPAVLRCVSHRAALRAVFYAWLAACTLPWALASRAPVAVLAAACTVVAALVNTLRALAVPLPWPLPAFHRARGHLLPHPHHT